MAGCLEFIVKEAAKAGVVAGAIAAGNHYLGREFVPAAYASQVFGGLMVMNAIEIAAMAIKSACGGYDRQRGRW